MIRQALAGAAIVTGGMALGAALLRRVMRRLIAAIPDELDTDL